MYFIVSCLGRSENKLCDCEEMLEIRCYEGKVEFFVFSIYIFWNIYCMTSLFHLYKVLNTLSIYPYICKIILLFLMFIKYIYWSFFLRCAEFVFFYIFTKYYVVIHKFIWLYFLILLSSTLLIENHSIRLLNFHFF